MAASSRPFQSQTVSRLLAGYRQFAHGTERWLRQGRTALLWGVQVALFPAYVGFQSVRTLSRRLQATQPWQKVTAWLTGQPAQVLPNGADVPLRALLSIIQPQIVRRPGGLRFVDRHGQLLRQSRAESVLTNGQWHLLPLQGAVRGVASDVATRHLVLVTANNAIFAGLTTDQQDRLHRAIVLLLAEYAASGRRQWRQQQLQSPSLPLPAAEATQWWPVQWLHRLMAWLQTSPLATTTNLFGEAYLQPAASLAPGNLSSSPAAAGYPSSPGANTRWALAQGRQMTGWPTSPSTATLAGSPTATTMVSATEISLRSASSLTQKATAAVDDVVDAVTGPGSLSPSGPDEPAPRILTAADAIEAHVTLVNYVDHPLVLALRWLDAVICAAETWVKRVWQWLLEHL